jgi:hypothetical protein
MELNLNSLEARWHSWVDDVVLNVKTCFEAAKVSINDDQPNGRWIVFLTWAAVVGVLALLFGGLNVFGQIFYLGAGLFWHWAQFDWKFGRQVVTINAVLEEEEKE